jgi:protein SCO1/2
MYDGSMHKWFLLKAYGQIKIRVSKMNKLYFILLTLLIQSSIANATEEMDMHAHHHHHTMSTEIKRSEVMIDLPDLQLVRQDGKNVKFPDELIDGRVVVLSYIYTSCTAICPMTSQTIFQLQGKLAADLDKVHLISISIDPEQDTPEILSKYAQKFHASKYWDYYTGTTEASIKLQKAMNAYLGDKMNHVPATFIWSGKSSSWIRIDGFASADDLLLEVQKLLPNIN